MRNLRAIYNRAVEQGFVTQQNPFKHVYTGIDKTKKRAVSLDVIREIRDLKLTKKSLVFCQGYLFIQLLYTWNVLCRYGIFKKARPAKWDSCLSEK